MKVPYPHVTLSPRERRDGEGGFRITGWVIYYPTRCTSRSHEKCLGINKRSEQKTLTPTFRTHDWSVDQSGPREIQLDKSRSVFYNMLIQPKIWFGDRSRYASDSRNSLESQTVNQAQTSESGRLELLLVYHAMVLPILFFSFVRYSLLASRTRNRREGFTRAPPTTEFLQRHPRCSPRRVEGAVSARRIKLRARRGVVNEGGRLS